MSRTCVLVGVSCKLATFKQAGKEGSCKHELVDEFRVCWSIHEVRVWPETFSLPVPLPGMQWPHVLTSEFRLFHAVVMPSSFPDTLAWEWGYYKATFCLLVPPGRSSNIPKIIYASRTHSQLSQVIRELKSTRYRSAQWMAPCPCVI